MYRRFAGTGLLFAFLLALGVPATFAQKKKPADDKADADVGFDSDKLPPGQFAGKLRTPPGSDGSFIVSVEYQHLELKNPGQVQNWQRANPGMQNLVQDQQRIAQAQAQVARARTQQQAYQALIQLQQAMAQIQQRQLQALMRPQQQGQQQSPYVVKTDSKDVTFHASEDMKVRFAKPPAGGFDDKGNPKTYTAEELKALKGTGPDAKLEGYEGSLDKLVSGMSVRVTTIFNRPKKEDKPKDAAAADKDKDKDAAADKDKAKDADKDKAKDAAANKDVAKAAPEKKDMGPKTVVSFILILGDPAGSSSDNPPPKKKKN